MIRPVVVYMLSAFILLSQVGLPVHLHYCKGMLESVAVFFNPGCDDHEPLTSLPACCTNSTTSSCSRDGGDCCDDKVQVLIQEILSPQPPLDKWIDFTSFFEIAAFPLSPAVKNICPASIEEFGSDNGPPIYLLHQALIFYA